MEKEIKRLSEELSIPKEVVKAAYKGYWKFIKEKIEALPLKENLSEAEFSSYRTNFSLIGLGKLYCTYPDYLKIKRQYDKHKKDKATE